MKRLLLSAPLLLALALVTGCSRGRAAPAASEMTKTPRPTFTDVPTATATPAATDTPTATVTPSPTDTPQPTPTATPRPTRVPPTAAPKPTATPAPQVGRHGIIGRLRLRENRTDYKVGERVFFVFEPENTTDSDIPFGILGLKGSNGQFQTSWTSEVYDWRIKAHSVFRNEDNMVFSAAGTYTVKLAICFATYSDCAGGKPDWEEFDPGVVVNIR